LDWVSELEDGAVDLVRAGLAVTKVDYLESPDGSVAIAAAEVIAAAVGSPAASLPASVTRWVDAHGASVADADVVLALAALDRVTAENSELAELWAESDDREWSQSVEDLRNRLSTAAK
jgi:hypothetical protein